MTLRMASLTFDCQDPNALATFWQEALGYVRGESESAGVAVIEDPRDRDPELVFLQVPEGKSVKNRLHLDIGADDVDREVNRLSRIGATKVEDFERWTVMHDPEGNEFCLLRISPDDSMDQWRTGK